MWNYAASATCLRQTTLFADTHVLAFIAYQWTMFDIYICDEKSNQYLHLVLILSISHTVSFTWPVHTWSH